MDSECPAFLVNGVRVPIVQELASKLNFLQSHHSPLSAETPDQHLILPERYVRPIEERPGRSAFICAENLLPVIDLSVINESPSEMDKLSRACREWGILQVVNHGIPATVMERMKGVAKEFFELPLQEKLKYSNQSESGNRVEGYTQTFVFSEQQPLEWADRFAVRALPQRSRKLHVWPLSPQDFRDTVDRFSKEAEQLIIRLLKLLARNLQLREETALVEAINEWNMFLRLNYYPPCPRPDLALGLAPHTDASIVTLVLQDDETEGLQILKDGQNEWISVKPISGSLVINFGDFMEVITNGRYKSIEHRVVNNATRRRMTVACFYGPAVADEVMGPLAELVDEDRPALYRTFTYAEFHKHFFGTRLEGKPRSSNFLKISK